LGEKPLSLQQVATTNLANCYRPSGSRKRNGTSLVTMCRKVHPLEELIEAIQPKAVFIAKAGAKAAGIDRTQCRVWPFKNAGCNQRQGIIISSRVDWLRENSWFPEAQNSYREMMRIGEKKR